MAQNGQDSVAMYRLKEAVSAVNMLLPKPITLEAAIRSCDGVRKLVKGQGLAKTYGSCLRKLECLSKHVPGSDNPSLDAVVRTHAENIKRMADTCAATLLHLYMAVDTAEGADAFVSHAIQLTAATETTMQEVAMAERALGIKPTRAKDSSNIIRDAKTAIVSDGDRINPCVPRPLAAYNGRPETLKNVRRERASINEISDGDLLKRATGAGNKRTFGQPELIEKPIDGGERLWALPTPPSELPVIAHGKKSCTTKQNVSKC